MPNRPVGPNRPHIEPMPNAPAARNNAPAGETRVTPESSTIRAHLDTFGRADAESLLDPSVRSRATVTSLKQAPGLLNGSVVLPHAGHQHPAVGQLQGALQALSQRTGQPELSVPRTGSWDAATAEAVKSFQRSQGLSADGIVGPRTAVALDRALKQGQPNSVLVGRLNELPSDKPKLDPQAVAKAAELLIEKHGNNYGVPDAWYNIDPNHALPAHVSLGGMKGKWKCNLFAGNAMRAAGFEPPYYGNRGQGEYPNANQFFKWSDKYAEQYGNKAHFRMVSELAVDGLDYETKKEKIIEVLKTIQPGDMVMADHLGNDVADGGHTRVAISAFDPETMTFEAAQASRNAGLVKTTGYGAFTGEEHIWVLRPNRPADD